MSMSEEIQRIFEKILHEEGGNKAAAAARLGTNAVTFWGWCQGKRGKKGTNALFNAIDASGAYLVLPWEDQGADSTRLMELEKQIALLKKENEKLQIQVSVLQDTLRPSTTPQLPAEESKKIA